MSGHVDALNARQAAFPYVTGTTAQCLAGGCHHMSNWPVHSGFYKIVATTEWHARHLAGCFQRFWPVVVTPQRRIVRAEDMSRQQRFALCIVRLLTAHQLERPDTGACIMRAANEAIDVYRWVFNIKDVIDHGVFDGAVKPGVMGNYVFTVAEVTFLTKIAEVPFVIIFGDRLIVFVQLSGC